MRECWISGHYFGRKEEREIAAMIGFWEELMSAGLSTKVVSALIRYGGYRSVTELRRSFRNDRFWSVRNIGIKGSREIAEFLSRQDESEVEYGECCDAFIERLVTA